MVQYFAYFENYTLVFNPKTLFIKISDTLGENTEETTFNTFQNAIKIVEELDKRQIYTNNMILENVHFAKIESFLSGFLNKIDNKYFLDLGEGRKFWIDNSNNKLEDETNDLQTRERIDSYLTDVVKSTSLMSDVDKMKEVLGLLIQLKAIESINPKIEENKITKIKGIDYIG
jgi:hypothetical protein